VINQTIMCRLILHYPGKNSQITLLLAVIIGLEINFTGR